MPKLRDQIKSILSKSCTALADEDRTELVKLMREVHCGPEMIELIESGKDFTDEQMEAVVKALGI